MLGGGAVAGGVVLVGGDPGVGKSTLLMQALAGLSGPNAPALYVTGEESAAQVALRADRLGLRRLDHLLLLATTDLGDVEAAWERVEPRVVVVDSVQTLRSSELESVAGSVSQIREVASRLTDLAKQKGATLFLIGHVTKEGALAGPKVLEHLVDAVVTFEGDRSYSFRMLRTAKNRYGPTHEVGVFEMGERGLVEVADPSSLFLAERREDAAGSVVVCTSEGSRPLLVELQALVAPAVYGSSRRVASGLDQSRLAILLAVIDRKAGIHVLDQDVFASVAGGARVDERALDLPLALAVVSSFRGRPIPGDLVAAGELGLTGEVRAVPRLERRLHEANKLGFRKALVPKTHSDRIDRKVSKAIEILAVGSLAEALEVSGVSS